MEIVYRSKVSKFKLRCFCSSCGDLPLPLKKLSETGKRKIPISYLSHIFNQKIPIQTLHFPISSCCVKQTQPSIPWFWGTIAVPVATNFAGRMRFLIPWRFMWRRPVVMVRGLERRIEKKTPGFQNNLHSGLCFCSFCSWKNVMIRDLYCFFLCETLLDTYDNGDELAM